MQHILTPKMMKLNVYDNKYFSLWIIYHVSWTTEFCNQEKYEATLTLYYYNEGIIFFGVDNIHRVSHFVLNFQESMKEHIAAVSCDSSA